MILKFGLLAVLLCVAQPAQAMDLKLFVGYALPGANISGAGMTGGTLSSSLAYGFGFDLTISKSLGVDFGGTYAARGFTVTDSTTAVTSTLTTQSFQFPIFFRVYYLKFISFGVGGYFSYALSGGTVTPAPVVSGTMSQDDWGLIGSVSMKIKLLPFLSAIADVRYLYSLENISQYASFSANVRDIQCLGGIQFGQ